MIKIRSRMINPIVGTVIISLLLFIPAYSYADSGSSLYNKFDRWISNFDPLGKALKPVKQIPKLKVDGMLYNTTLVNIHEGKKTGFVDRDWRFQEIQWRGELGLRYQLSNHAEMVTRFQYAYDTVYDWQSSNLYADKIHSDSYRLPSDHILRECHLDLELEKWKIKLGKQQVVWGKMEGRWMDFVNNLDAKDGLQIRASAYDQLRIPLWMANATCSLGKSSLQMLWIPDYEPERTPYPGSPFWFPVMPDPAWDGIPVVKNDEPDMGSIKNHQAAMRINTTAGSSTYSIGYMYGYSKTPTNFIKLDDADNPFYEQEYTRSHYFGASADGSHFFRNVPIIRSLPLAYRFEAVYQTDRYFRDYSEWDPQNLTLISGDGVSKTDVIRGSAQFTFYFPHQISAFYQPSFDYYTDWKRSFGFNEKTISHLIFFTKLFERFENRFRFSAYVVWVTGDPVNSWQGSRFQIIPQWYLSDNLELSLIYTDYRGGENDLFGQFDNYDNAGIELKYVF